MPAFSNTDRVLMGKVTMRNFFEKQIFLRSLEPTFSADLN